MSIDLAARHAWMAAVCADQSLPHTALRVAMLIGLHLNQKTGRCDPSKDTLARKTGSSVRSVDRAVAILVERGWIAVDRSNGRASNNYALRRMLELAQSNPVMRDGVEGFNPVTGDAPTPSKLWRGNREENRTPLTPHGGTASDVAKGRSGRSWVARTDASFAALVAIVRKRNPAFRVSSDADGYAFARADIEAAGPRLRVVGGRDPPL